MNISTGIWKDTACISDELFWGSLQLKLTNLLNPYCCYPPFPSICSTVIYFFTGETHSSKGHPSQVSWSSLASTEVLLRVSWSAMQCLHWKVFRLKVKTPRAVLDLFFLMSEVDTNLFKEWRSTTTPLMDLLPHCSSGTRFKNLHHTVHPMSAECPWVLPAVSTVFFQSY